MAEITYYPPEYKSKNFHCSICHVYADQTWWKVSATNNAYDRSLTGEIGLESSRCGHCNEFSLWIEGQLSFPVSSSVPGPNQDMPEEVKKLYQESAQVLPYSLRASAALLRLGLQLLLGSVGGKGKNINDDIGAIVKSGVEPETQKALDILRVFGNNGAHPGEIQVDENSELVLSMFGLMNFIVDRLITQKKQINAMFDDLPDSVKQQIENRDKGGIK